MAWLLSYKYTIGPTMQTAIIQIYLLRCQFHIVQPYFIFLKLLIYYLSFCYYFPYIYTYYQGESMQIIHKSLSKGGMWIALSGT